MFQQVNEIHERDQLQLNRLEAYILKLVLPFLRIAHCPKGPYLKIKGDLILITADIAHSLSRVLPVEQNLIPVCFKRRLAFSGSYVSEYVEKNKIIMYFNRFKAHNHLFKNVELDVERMDAFEANCLSDTSKFESITKGIN